MKRLFLLITIILIGSEVHEPSEQVGNSSNRDLSFAIHHYDALLEVIDNE